MHAPNSYVYQCFYLSFFGIRSFYEIALITFRCEILKFVEHVRIIVWHRTPNLVLVRKSTGHGPFDKIYTRLREWDEDLRNWAGTVKRWDPTTNFCLQLQHKQIEFLLKKQPIIMHFCLLLLLLSLLLTRTAVLNDIILNQMFYKIIYFFVENWACRKIFGLSGEYRIENRLRIGLWCVLEWFKMNFCLHFTKSSSVS